MGLNGSTAARANSTPSAPAASAAGSPCRRCPGRRTQRERPRVLPAAAASPIAPVTASGPPPSQQGCPASPDTWVRGTPSGRRRPAPCGVAVWVSSPWPAVTACTRTRVRARQPGRRAARALGHEHLEDGIRRGRASSASADRLPALGQEGPGLVGGPPRTCAQRRSGRTPFTAGTTSRATVRSVGAAWQAGDRPTRRGRRLGPASRAAGGAQAAERFRRSASAASAALADLHQRGEGRGVVDGELGEHAAVHLHVGQP